MRSSASQPSYSDRPANGFYFQGYPAGTRFGDYELLEEIARGGMGIVFRARQLSLDRVVAFKLLLWGPYSSAEFAQLFHTDALAAASLQHPNLVAIHEIGFRDRQHFLVMEHVGGPSLTEVVREGSLSARRAASYVKTIAEAIHYAHERGILHRNLRPSNVLIDPSGRPKVTDLGLSNQLLSDSSLGADPKSITLTGQVLSSPNYISPEQASGRHGQVDRRSDVYSLGAILYHLLTGQPPFAAESVPETLHQVFCADAAPPSALNAGVPWDLESICLKCLEKDPSRRYSTAQNLADDLGRFLRDQPIRARLAGRAEQAWRWVLHNPVFATLIAVVSLTFFMRAAIVWHKQHSIKEVLEELELSGVLLALAISSFCFRDPDPGKVHYY